MDETPGSYFRITRRFLEEISAVTPQKRSRKPARELAAVLYGRAADRLRSTYVPASNEKPFEARISDVVAFLNSEGFEFEVERVNEGFVIRGRGCPCARLASEPTSICGHDQMILGGLLKAEVERLEGGREGASGLVSYQVSESKSRRL